MKKVIILLMILISFIVHHAEAQNAGRFPGIRERIAHAKLREIRQQLNLDQATFDRFSPVYLRYEREVSAIDFRSLARLMKVNADSLSAEEADQLLVGQLNAAKRLINIREKYNKEFREVISAQQIIKLYQAEAEMRKKVFQEMKRRMIRQ